MAAMQLAPRHLLALTLAIGLATPSCSALAGFNLVPDTYANSLGVSAYSEQLGQSKVITGTPDAEMVNRIGQKIAAACDEDFEWEFALLDEPQTPNAWCLPGGKVAVYTGILPITQNEDALAAVMGHEVAHAVLRHGSKRMTSAFLSQGALTAVQATLSMGDMSSGQQGNVMQALGMATQFGATLPFSRAHESEADVMGLRYLVRAGYDPNEAPKLWERMAQLGGGERQPEFMSTHPDPLNRAETLRQLIPRIVEEERGNMIANPAR